jgi:hypothetical protein
MTNLSITTLDELLHKDQLSIGDLKRAIKDRGVCFVDGYGEWKAAPADEPSSDSPIEAALSALREYAHIRRSDTDLQLIEEYYRKPDSQPICFYGFNQDTAGKLFVGKADVQNQEERIEQLTSEVASATNQNDLLKTGITNLEIELETANEKLEQQDEKSPVHDLRAIAVNAWLHSKDPCTRRELWANMQKIDPKLFGNTNSDVATERAVDRVNAAHQKRYGVAIEYPDGNN